MLRVSLLVISILLWASPMMVIAETEEEDTCGLYLAISSTSTVEETNWGLYAGRTIPPNSPIGSPDVAILIPHLRSNSYFVEEVDDDSEENIGKIVDFFEGFFWVPDTGGGKFELHHGRSVAAIPGAGVLAAYSSKRTNADWNVTAPYYRSNVGMTSKLSHPNRGAISPFYNTQVVSTQEIPVGSEIFMEFGDNWSDDDEDDELSQSDYKRIDQTVTQMIDFFNKHEENLDQDSKNEIYTFLTKDVLKAAIGYNKARKVSSMLPPNPDDLPKVIAAGGALKFSDPTAFRTQEWLETYGLCMDNIRDGPSTIPNAGRGAFATRKIKKDGLVAPVPATHIPDKSVLDMHELEENEDGELVRASDTVTSQQLMINYCYAHPESSMIFFPSGAVAPLINHSDEPNAKIVWSKHPNHQKMWLSLDPLTDLLDEDHMYIGLMFEIIALRDIEPNEEIFIDYGPEWKAAYEKHTKEWENKIKNGEIPNTWPLTAVDMNNEYLNKPFLTPDELEKDPYPENVNLYAFLLLQDTANEGTIDDPKKWGEDDDETAYVHDNLFEITVVERTKVEDDDKYTYKVEWHNEHGQSTVVEDVPHDAIIFIDEPETSDQFFIHGFRHPIGLPDELIPDAWRNMK